MKKILLGALALVAVASFSSCNKCGESCTTGQDSLSLAYGKYVGSTVSNDLRNMDKGDAANREDMVRGMQLVFGADANEATRIGMQVALSVASEVERYESMGVHLDSKVAFKAMRILLLNDSLTMDQVSIASADFQRLFTEAMEKARAEQEAAKAEEPTVSENDEAAQKFIADLKANNPNVKTSPSGLVYVIETEGEGAHPSEVATTNVIYTGKHINGEVFDSSEGKAVQFPLTGVIPGFSEGLRMLGKGGKATLYIPGNLGYGPNGIPQAGIGPNEMLIFDVELVDFVEE